MKGIIKKGIFGFLFLFIGFSFASINGKVFTLPVQIGEEGPQPTPVSGASIIFNEHSLFTAGSNENGEYTLDLPTYLLKSTYILKVTHTDYIPAYTIPAFYEDETPDFEHDIMVFSIAQLENLEISLESGKGALIVVTQDPISEEFITGAEAIVKYMNNQSVGTIKYIAIDLDPESQWGIVLKDNPDENPEEQGGTFGFIAYNIDPGLVMVSASKDGYSFLWRPAFIYQNSITSGVSMYDCILGFSEQVSLQDFTGKLVDEKGEPVEGATVSLCGMGISATTDNREGYEGIFTLRNIPAPAIAILKASRAGYKDTYMMGFIEPETPAEDEEVEEFIIISEEFVNNLGIDFSDEGVFAGIVEDINGEPVKNAEITAWNSSDTEGNARYVDCMRQTIDENLQVTSDSGIFIVDKSSYENISTTKPLYLSFVHRDIDGIAYYNSFHYLGFIFQDGITIMPLEIEKNVGSIEISGTKESIVADPDEEVDLLKMNLNVYGEGGNPKYLTGFTITYEDPAPYEVTLYKKAGENWEEVSCGNSINENEIRFINIEDLTLPAEILVKGKFNQEDRGEEFSCKLEKNCDVIVKTNVDIANVVYVSVGGAPVDGNRVFIKTLGRSIGVEPEELNFGNVNVGSSEKLEITVVNTGTETVEISCSIEGTNADNFSVNHDSVEIEEGGQENLEVTFTPTSAGEKNAVLRISYLEGDDDILVPLTGTGVSVPAAGGGGGCFIATAAFGSPLHRYVKILREFRDRYLVSNKIGRAFVRWYYKTSPAIARIIEKNVFLKIITRIFLLPLIFVAYIILKGLIPYLVIAGCISAISRKRK